MVKDLQWETLEERRRSNRLCMLYRIANNLVDIDQTIYLRFTDQRTEFPAYRNTFFPPHDPGMERFVNFCDEGHVSGRLDIYCLQLHQSNNQPQYDDVYSLTMCKDQTEGGCAFPKCWSK